MSAEPRGWRNAFESIVGIRAGAGTGTGWVGAPNVIVTNHHVVGYLSEIDIKTYDGERMRARVIHADPRNDIAFVVPLEPVELPALELGPSDSVERGEPVVVIGHPRRLSMTVTRGIVSAPMRRMERSVVMQTDAAVNRGNSGGPLLDLHGRVLGTIRFIFNEAQNLSFAVPVHEFAAALRALPSEREVLLGLQPVYRCPVCNSAYSIEDRGCRTCGEPIPFSDFSVLSMGTQAFTRAEQSARRLIQRIGFVPERVRIARGIWRLDYRANSVVVVVEPDGRHVSFNAALARLPERDFEPFYRFLLTANDWSSGPCRLGLAGETVVVSFAEPSEFLNEQEVAGGLTYMLELADRARAVLANQFGAPPPPDTFAFDLDDIFGTAET